MRAAILLCVSVFLVCAFAATIQQPKTVEELYKSQLSEGSFASGEDTVTTQYGPIKGAVYETARAFYAIPYAQPPTGNLRFEMPQAPTAWSGTLHAKVYGPGCPQDCGLPPFTCTYAGTNENCLTLDVYTPRLGSFKAPAPVVVFIHGGNFIQGGTGTILYNANFLANNTQVVVVNIQYRLGALGFFYNGNVTGNFAIYDQTAALQWVKGNIAAFGGNPNQVTVWGQSAGGTSTAIHLISPASNNLINGAAMDSNPITLNLNSIQEAKEISSRFATLLNCSDTDLACLRSQTTDAILAAQNSAVKLYLRHPLNAFMPWQPMVDGTLIPYQPLTAFKNGNYNKNVPFITGTVNNEGLMFIYQAFPTPVTFDEYIAIIGLIFGTEAPKVLQQYPVPPSQYNDTRNVIAALGTDYIFLCPLRQAVREMTSFGTNVHYYHFDHAFTNFNPWGPSYPECVGFVCHGSELPYIFNSAEIGSLFTGYIWSSSEAVLAAQISTFWGNFATSGNPNTPFPVTLNWPVYNQTTDQDMKFDTPSAVESGYESTNCNFWDTIGYTFGN